MVLAGLMAEGSKVTLSVKLAASVLANMFIAPACPANRLDTYSKQSNCGKASIDTDCGHDAHSKNRQLVVVFVRI